MDGKVTIVDPLADKFALVRTHTIAFVPLVACLFVAAMLVSAIGCGVTMRRFLKV